MEILKTLEVMRSDGATKEVEIIRFADGRVALHDSDDTNYDCCTTLADDSDLAVRDALLSEWEIVE